MAISIFDKEDWRKYLPQKLKVITDNGDFELDQTDVLLNGDLIQVSWYQKTFKGPNDVNDDGEPDYIEFDIHMVKTNDGTEANPDNLKLNIDITYGDSMVSAFTISMPGEVNVTHYNGFGSKYDKETEFGFEDETIKELVEFFNRFGFQLDSKDFTFIDKYKDSYTYVENIKYIQTYESFRIKRKNNNYYGITNQPRRTNTRTSTKIYISCI